MKKTTAIPPSGVQIENSLSMALHTRGRKRHQLELALLAALGTFSMLFTFLTMFSPFCNVVTVVLFSAVLVAFFCFHAGASDTTHYTLLLLLIGYAVFFYWKREMIAAGLMYLMNDVYRAIYITDWDYFTTNPAFEPQSSTTLALCFVLVPLIGLLSYAVMRFRNLFLCLLVTFPFVELGFFFGIAPEHIPAAGLVAFWCGMAAAQLASGTSPRHEHARSGFVRRGGSFLPITKMRFLLTEHAGVCMALLVFALCMAGEAWMHATNYQRPDKVKDMRTAFQYYAASIDWSDLNTIFPFLKGDDQDEPQEYIDLGRSDKREFENTVVSTISMTQRPLGRVYLKFSTYQNYDKSRWRTLDETAYRDPAMAMFRDVDYYPSEFLFYASQSLGYETAQLTLENPDATLSRCVPYGFQKDEHIFQNGDMILSTAQNSYTVFAGDNYENLLLGSISYDVPVGTQLEICPEADQKKLARLLGGEQERIVQFPQSAAFGSMYFGDEEGLSRRAEAAVLSASGYTDFAYKTYTQVPDTEVFHHIEGLFSDLTEGFDARTATPAETMIVLEKMRARLCANVTYSLSPGKTPPGEDYVGYFLLDNQKGYCTHYATAGTLLARMAGIPSRYCEGYLVDGSALTESGSGEDLRYQAKILDSNAHAWTEIYIEGFGWIPFEFTFSYFTPPELPTEAETEPPTEGFSEDPTEAEPETQPETTMVPVPVATEPVTQEVPEVTEPEMNWTPVLISLACVIFVGGILLTFVLLRRRALDKRMVALSDPIGDASARYAWQLLLDRMAYCGVNVHAPSTDALQGEMQSKCGKFLTEREIHYILRCGTKLRYSPRGLKEAEREFLIAALDKLTHNIYEAANPLEKLWLKWFRHYL